MKREATHIVEGAWAQKRSYAWRDVVIRAVIDTNVLVSGLLSPAGDEALILLAIHQGHVRPCSRWRAHRLGARLRG